MSSSRAAGKEGEANPPSTPPSPPPPSVPSLRSLLPAAVPCPLPKVSQTLSPTRPLRELAWIRSTHRPRPGSPPVPAAWKPGPRVPPWGKPARPRPGIAGRSAALPRIPGPLPCPNGKAALSGRRSQPRSGACSRAMDRPGPLRAASVAEGWIRLPELPSGIAIVRSGAGWRGRRAGWTTGD